MPGTDIHTHLAPRLDAAAVAQLGGVDQDPDGVLTLDGHRAGPPALYDPSALEDYLDRAGLDHAVVSVPPPFYRQHLDPLASAEWARTINDGLADAIGDRSRLRALAYLPLEYPDVALAEYQRTRADNRFVGVTASAGGGSVVASDQRLEPLWKELDVDETVVLLHPGSSPDVRLDAFYLSNLLGNPAETAVAPPGLRPRMLEVLPDLVERWSAAKP